MYNYTMGYSKSGFSKRFLWLKYWIWQSVCVNSIYNMYFLLREPFPYCSGIHRASLTRPQPDTAGWQRLSCLGYSTLFELYIFDRSGKPPPGYCMICMVQIVIHVCMKGRSSWSSVWIIYTRIENGGYDMLLLTVSLKYMYVCKF